MNVLKTACNLLHVHFDDFMGFFAVSGLLSVLKKADWGTFLGLAPLNHFIYPV